MIKCFPINLPEHIPAEETIHQPKEAMGLSQNQDAAILVEGFC